MEEASIVIALVICVCVIALVMGVVTTQPGRVSLGRWYKVIHYSIYYSVYTSTSNMISQPVFQ